MSTLRGFWQAHPTGFWRGSNPEGCATMIYLEAMETAALWKSVAKLNNSFSPLFHKAWKTRCPKRYEFSPVPTASATGYRFIRKLPKGCFACFIFLGMQFLKNLNPCSFYSLATTNPFPFTIPIENR
jgi:hypothetical protein